MWCLPLSLLAKNSALSRDTTCASKKPLNPNLIFQESTIPTKGLRKIPQVSCHRCKKAITIASKCVRSFSVRENWALHELVMVKNKSDRLHNKGCYHKGQYNVMFFCTKGLNIQTNKRMATSASLCEGPIFYFYAKIQSFSLYSFYFSLLASIMWCGKI